MRYIYMNNFRGFTEAIVPLKQTNFLLGENSTGKSSFLSLYSLLNNGAFWVNPSLSIREEFRMMSFADIVSAWSKDRSYFQVGAINTTKAKSGGVQLQFHIHEFMEFEDSPRLHRHFQLTDGHLTTIIFDPKKTKYLREKLDQSFVDEASAVAAFQRLLNKARGSQQGMKSLPKDFPPNPPLTMAIAIIYSLEHGGEPSKTQFKIEFPFSMNVAWIAPIRTKPKRIYDGVRVGYSPEGEHAPLLLRKSLKNRSSAKRFANKLAEFGKASGLFETVTAHSFGSGSKDPFELVVKFEGADLNINNVGYGVSQALPLVVEFLAAEKRIAFAVQQPEVHLHPKAQAALGGLVFELAHNEKHSFFVETHSDYLIDRYRLAMKSEPKPPPSQVLFFNRTALGNVVHPLEISSGGTYPQEQPKEFRDFFIKEEISLLSL